VAPAFSEKELFFYLLSEPLNEFKITRMALNAEVNLPIYQKLDILRDAEGKINSDSNALYPKRHSSHRQNSSDSGSYISCSLCSGRHSTRECEYRHWAASQVMDKIKSDETSIVRYRKPSRLRKKKKIVQTKTGTQLDQRAIQAY
jgi:hypothetical protein